MSFQHRPGRLLAAVSALLLTLGLAALAPAAADELYEVRGVEVDVTAADAAQAREAAIAMGQSRALQRLWARLVPADRLNSAPSLGSERIAELIEDFGVSNERGGENSYSGTFNVRFRPAEIRRTLRDAGVPYAEQRGRPLVLLPLFADDSGTRLWDDPNPWRRTWQRRSEVGLVPLAVPLGDLSDISAIDAARAEAQDRQALDAIARTHGAEEVLITIARQSGDPDRGEAGLSIELRRIGPGRDGGMEMESLRQREGEPTQRFYDRAADAVAARVQEEWKRDNLLRFDRQNELIVRVPVRDLREWVQVRRRLDATSSVVEQEILHLSRGQGILALSYVGEEAQLARALAQRELALIAVPPDTPGLPAWQLTLGAGAGPLPGEGQEEGEAGAVSPREEGAGSARDDSPTVRLPQGFQ